VRDHSIFSKNWHGGFRESDLLRELIESVVRRCMAEGLVVGEGFTVALASSAPTPAGTGAPSTAPRGLPPAAAGRAVEEYLAVLDDAAFGAATPVMPKYISLSDPASRWTGAHAYGSAEMLDWLVHEQGIEPHIWVFDMSKRDDDIFSSADFKGHLLFTELDMVCQIELIKVRSVHTSLEPQCLASKG
jgi:hypothetical protein